MNDSNNNANLLRHSEISHDAILAIQTRQLYQSIYSSLVATVVNACFLVFVLWSVIAHDTLIVWITILLVISLVRGLTAFQFKKIVEADSSQISLWYRRFYTGAFFAAFTWSSTALFLFPVDDIVRQVFLAFILGGIIAGSLATLSYSKQLIQLFLIIIAVPLVIRFFSSNSEISVIMALMFFFYLLMMLIAARRIHENLKHNIYLHLDSVERERTLEHSKQHYQTILETAKDLYFLYNNNGKIVDINKQSCDELGYSREELLSFSIKDIIHLDTENKILKQWFTEQREFITGKEVMLCRKDGTTFPVELSVGKIATQGESLYSAFVRDITERQRIDKMKNEFISTVSHELRTPLTSIRGSLGLILGGAVGDLPKTMVDMLKLASSNTERLLLLINDILDVQKIESGDMSFDVADVNLLELIEKSIVENSPYAKQYGVSFIINEKINNATVLADQSRIMQVLANLLSNAAKFSHKGGNVEISLSKKQNSFRVAVTDHGQGIPKDFYDKIFTKFTQHDSSDIRQKGGTGLGLNISKKIIKKHAGILDFYSKEGEGSTFYFELEQHIGV